VAGVALRAPIFYMRDWWCGVIGDVLLVVGVELVCQHWLGK